MGFIGWFTDAYSGLKPVLYLMEHSFASRGSQLKVIPFFIACPIQFSISFLWTWLQSFVVQVDSYLNSLVPWVMFFVYTVFLSICSPNFFHINAYWRILITTIIMKWIALIPLEFYFLSVDLMIRLKKHMYLFWYNTFIRAFWPWLSS